MTLPLRRFRRVRLENLYWQVFAGETHLQTALPIDPSSLSRRCKRSSEAGVEELLVQSMEYRRNTQCQN